MSTGEVLVERQPAVHPHEFTHTWEENAMWAGHPAINAGMEAVNEQLTITERAPSLVQFTDVTLRDGQQQQTNEVTLEERVEVFDNIVSTGVDRIEIGHLGNAQGDQQ